MKWKAAVGGISLAVLLAGGGYAVWYNSDLEEAKRAVRGRLDDPSSAIFSDIEDCGNDGPIKIVVGKVNYRNRQGGMQGKTTFIIRGYGFVPFADVSRGLRLLPNVADAFDDAHLELPLNTSCPKVFRRAQQILEEKNRALNEDDELQPMSAGEPDLGNMDFVK